METLRLETVKKLGAADANIDFAFKSIVALAAELTDAPISLISLAEASRPVFRAAFGADLRETLNDGAFCQFTLQTTSTLVVPDAARDPRFQDSPLVQGPMGYRFYAGTPLNVHGYNVGTLSVVDRRPRQLDPRKKLALEVLAGLAASVIQNQFNLRQLEARLAVQSERREALGAA
jgi:GAF domain-containing protein